MKASSFGILGVVAMAANLVFWLALAYGLLRLARHFGILAALGAS